VLCVVLLWWCFFFLFFDRPSGTIPACSFYSLKEVQGYKILAYNVTLLVEEPGGLGRALSDGDVVCTVEAWRRYFWCWCYMSRHARHY
jgi:hypothetical protein